MRHRVIYGLTAHAAVFSLGHHVDHIMRGNHVGWPVTGDVNAFTFSLGIYPILMLALALYRSGRIGPGTWALISGSGALFVSAIHFGPMAIEPPADIIGLYPAPIGWFWFAWLLAFVGILVVTCAVETRLWLGRRAARLREPA